MPVETDDNGFSHISISSQLTFNNFKAHYDRVQQYIFVQCTFVVSLYYCDIYWFIKA